MAKDLGMPFCVISSNPEYSALFSISPDMIND
jgi:hypothetical protein